MPGTELYPGLTEPTPLSEVDLTITIDAQATTTFCNQKMWEHEMYWELAVIALGNFGIQFGCAEYHIEDGKVKKCDVYVAWEWYLLDHELRHCMGYADKWY